MFKIISFILIYASFIAVSAQSNPDKTYLPNIKTISFYKYQDPLAYPMLRLHSNESLEMHFDDLDGDVKNYYFSIQLCNAEWLPEQLNYFDYAKGYSQIRINNYKTSSIALTRYTHYQFNVPDKNCMPTRSGNYLVKVFQDGDPTKLVFTRRMLVVEEKLNVSIQITQPFNQKYFQTHHRVQLQLETAGMDIRYPQQQLKIKLLQNYRWDNAISIQQPTFIRQGLIHYNNENTMIFPAGKEYRWLNLRSFRLLSDRMTRQQNTNSAFELFVKEDQPRLAKQYFYYRDLNGLFINETIDQLNPYWNADYAKVHFTFRPKDGLSLAQSELYVIGGLTNYGEDEDAKMEFNADKGVYETTLYLKQGYYDYIYAIRQTENGQISYNTTLTEQDAWETENVYMVLVYYRDLGGRSDQLLAIRQINSQFNRTMQ